MLESLRIENFAIIEHLEVDFNKGLNVIVGQTGAGKTIIMEALGLICGTRAEFSKLKDESKKAVVEASFNLSSSFIESHSYLKDYLEDNTLILSRILTPTKKNQAKINGELVNLSTLKRVATDLVDIFSQGDSSYLLNPAKQLELVDMYTSNNDLITLKEKFKSKYNQLQDLKADIEEYKKETNISMKDFYKFEIDEIESYHLKENEIEDLNNQKDELSKYESTQNAFKDFSSSYYINDQVNVNDLLNSLKTTLNGLNDTLLESQANKAKEDIYNLEDSLNDIFSSYDNLDFSPTKLDSINKRLFDLTTLQRKYGKSTNQILSTLEDLKLKYEKIINFDDNLKALESNLKAIEEQLNQIAIKLSSCRKQVSKRLIKDVNSQLESLGLNSNGFDIKISEQELSSTGVDKVEFVVNMNSTNKYLSLKQALSGGENSRLNLALKTVFNNSSITDTLVFDEIDSGISGGVGYKAGLKMVEISKKSTVIVITHLSQVLALADQAYLVYKQDKGGEISSSIKQLNEEELINQIANINSSSNISKALITASRELRNQALEDKKTI